MILGQALISTCKQSKFHQQVGKTSKRFTQIRTRSSEDEGLSSHITPDLQIMIHALQLCSSKRSTQAKQVCLRKWKVVTGSGRGLCPSDIKLISSVRLYKNVCLLKRQSSGTHSHAHTDHFLQPLTSFMLTQKKSSVCSPTSLFCSFHLVHEQNNICVVLLLGE